MSVEHPSIEALIASDATHLCSRAPARSALYPWHHARRQAAQRLERKLLWLAGGALLLLATALLPSIARMPTITWWWLPLPAVLWPLRGLLR